MARPQFTLDEQHVIASCLADNRPFFDFEMRYLVPSYVMAAYGWMTVEMAPLLLALGVIAVGKIWELSRQRKWAPCWKNIIRKYEEALADGQDQSVV